MQSKLAAAILFLAGTNAFAQSNQGTITGCISEPAGAVVAAAAIEVRNVETGGDRSRLSRWHIRDGQLRALSARGNI